MKPRPRCWTSSLPRSRDVPPSFSVSYVVNIGGRHAMSGGCNAIRSFGISDRRDTLVRQFTARVSYPGRDAILADGISQVIKLRADKEMRWVHAKSNVAMVADQQARGDWSVMEFPRHAMRQNQSAIYVDCSVAPPRGGSCPQPT